MMEPKPEEWKEELRQKVEQVGRVRSPEELRKPVRVLKYSELQEVVRDIVSKYAGLSHRELIAEMTALYLENQNLKRRPRDAELEKELEALRFREEVLLQEAAELRERVRTLSQQLEAAVRDAPDRDLASLRAQVEGMRARIRELEVALDHFDMHRMPDRQAVLSALDKVRERFHILVQNTGFDARARRLVDFFDGKERELRANAGRTDQLLDRMREGKATVGVISELARLDLEARAIAEQVQTLGLCLEYFLKLEGQE